MSMLIHFGLLTDLYMMMYFVNRIRSCLYLLILRHFGLLSLSLRRFDSLMHSVTMMYSLSQTNFLMLTNLYFLMLIGTRSGSLMLIRMYFHLMMLSRIHSHSLNRLMMSMHLMTLIFLY